jgi:hypothetical protein
VEQYPLSVKSLATFPNRFPEQIIIGIESNKLWLEKQLVGKYSISNALSKLLKASDKLFNLLLNAEYEPSFGNQECKYSKANK